MTNSSYICEWRPARGLGVSSDKGLCKRKKQTRILAAFYLAVQLCWKRCPKDQREPAPVLPRCRDAVYIRLDISAQAAALWTAQMCTLLFRCCKSQKDARLDLGKHIWMCCLLQLCIIPSNPLLLWMKTEGTAVDNHSCTSIIAIAVWELLSASDNPWDLQWVTTVLMGRVFWGRDTVYENSAEGLANTPTLQPFGAHISLKGRCAEAQAQVQTEAQISDSGISGTWESSLWQNPIHHGLP